MNILFLRGFNNYFNRTVKKYSTLTDYQSNSTAYMNFGSINFNPNDGVATELILGNESQKENNLPLDWENIGTPDYCICYEMAGNPETEVIKSRWFVLESERLRTGQYRLALKRDVVAEHFDQIKTAPCFIEKGMINEINNSLLYNKESMTYNQIKTAEYPLKDSTGCGWIVGYVPKNTPETAGSNIEATILMEGAPSTYYEPNELPFSIGLNTNYAYDALQMKIELVQLGSYVTTDYAGTYYGAYQSINSYVLNMDDSITKSKVNYKYSVGSVGSGRPSSVSGAQTKLIEKGYYYGDSAISKKNMSHLAVTCSSQGQQYPAIYGFAITEGSPNYLARTTNSIATIASTFRSHAKTACSTAFSQYGPVADGMEQYNGKFVKYNNKYYKMNVTKISYRTGVIKVNSSNDWNISATDINIDGLTQYISTITNETHLSNLRSDISSFFSTAYKSNNSSYNTLSSFDVCGISMPRYSITLELISTETLVIADRAASTRNHTYDNSADIFAIPYGEMQYTYNGDYNYTSANRGLAMARAIASRYSDSCYDLQIVPYCPSATARSEVDESGEINLDYWDAKTYQVYTSDNIAAGFVLWVSASKDTFDIPLNLQPEVGQGNSPALVYKLTNETQLCRIASPNFSGQFEFSLAKNNGITKFNVDYTYKPYAPYIHVNPDFKGLYASHWNENGDWDDARGLICGGDFSLNHITSYWQTYMNNNKNYQQIFDRQIQNMDVNNTIALEKQEFQATVGTITSAIGGALGGGAAGATVGSAAGPWGALIGGVVGAVGGGVGSGLASAYGAEKDRDWLQRQQVEARSYAIDMYGYQLGNIQAMPYSIKGTDALTNNNKIWPILEIYNATDLEVELLKSKIQYNGMTIMAVGNIQDYCTSEDFDNVFIKGQMIRVNSENLNDDFHIADAIYQEINKGVYIPSGGL